MQRFDQHMMMAKARRWLLAVLLLAPFDAGAQPAAAWSDARGPAPGPARIIGGTTLGCLAGAEQLPADGPGWQAVRLARDRHWGHPALLDYVRSIASRTTAAGLPPLLIGDLAQPRGGPMPYGHASHQTGLDVDIWLDVVSRRMLDATARENPVVPSVVAADGAGVAPERWRPAHATLIRLAASAAEVDRVLVNPAIKRALCGTDAGAAWLRRIRPWWGHDAHMHIRLRCPPGQPDCREIAPPPPGDGCDASLDWWFTAEARRPTPRAPGPPPALPAACAGILAR